MRSLATQRF